MWGSCLPEPETQDVFQRRSPWLSPRFLGTGLTWILKDAENTLLVPSGQATTWPFFPQFILQLVRATVWAEESGIRRERSKVFPRGSGGLVRGRDREGPLLWSPEVLPVEGA